MRQIFLIEEKLPPKLPVRFSYKIFKQIKTIYNKNQDNINALSQWYEYIDSLKSYISNRSIAWDYACQYPRSPKGAIHIRDLGFDVTFIVKVNKKTNESYVYVFKVDLKPEEFGLEENKSNINSIDRIIIETINNYLKRNLWLVS